MFKILGFGIILILVCVSSLNAAAISIYQIPSFGGGIDVYATCSAEFGGIAYMDLPFHGGDTVTSEIGFDSFTLSPYTECDWEMEFTALETHFGPPYGSQILPVHGLGQTGGFNLFHCSGSPMWLSGWGGKYLDIKVWASADSNEMVTIELGNNTNIPYFIPEPTSLSLVVGGVLLAIFKKRK